MKQLDTLARHTLDTLPINIAVLDAEGTILFTNRSWREFGGAGPTEKRDMVGVNYFDQTDTESDEFAGEALDGIRTVIDGEQDLFTLEYPCHSPEEKRWFLMRATSLAEGDQGRVVVAHIDITDRKLAELRADRQRRDLERLTGRLQGLVGDVMEAVLLARTREEIETTVCERLGDVEPYGGAWVGRADLRTDEVVPVAWSCTASPEGDTISLDDETDPTVRALTEGTVVVEQITDADSLDSLHRRATEEPPGGVAALPLTYGETSYGVLTVYASDPSAVDERELAVLEVLARVTSTAINAVEGRRILTADEVVELELSISDEGLFYRDLAASLDCELTYEGTIYDESGVRMLFVAAGVDPDTLEDVAGDHSAVRSVSVLEADGDRSVVEFAVAEPPVIATLADQGAETTAIDVDSSGARLTVEFPAGTDTRAVLAELGEHYPSVELLARRERERSDQTRRELIADIEDRLTDRQRLALQKAYLGGFFDWPREASGEELAESMDISPSTYHQHLRTAERKVLASLFED